MDKNYDTVAVLRNGKLHLIISTQKENNQNLRTELAGVLKLNQERKNSAFLFAEMGFGQAEQHLSWPPVYTLFFVCLALVVVQGSAKS